MALSSDTLRLDEARRIALAAQGFADPRPAGQGRPAPLPPRARPGRRSCRSTRSTSSPAPTSCRSSPGSGPTPATRWPAGCGAAARCSSTGATRRRCCPVELHPLLRWRMQGDHQWTGRGHVPAQPPRARTTAILDAVAERGPVPLGQLEHLGDAIKRTKPAPGNMWNWTPAKKAVEWLFWTGDGHRRAQPGDLRAQLRRCPTGSCPPTCWPRPTPTDDDAQKAAAPAGGPQPRRGHRPRPGRLPPHQHHGGPPAAGRAGRRRRPAAGRGRGLAPPGLPAPRRRAAPLGAGLGAAVAVRLAGVGARPHRGAVRLPLPHRDLRAGGQAGARLLRAPLPAPRRAGRPASTSRPTARPGTLLVQSAHGEAGDRPGRRGRGPRRAAARSWPAFLGLADVAGASRQGDLAAAGAQPGRSGEDLDAVGGDHERVLELGGAAAVAR